MKKSLLFALLGLISTLLSAQNQLDNKEDSVVLKSIFEWDNTASQRFVDGMYWNHVIIGQKARNYIIGKFDGNHIDSLYIDCVFNDSKNSVRYYLKSRSNRLPKVELYGCQYMTPLIYEEGDLDGNGTDDLGYLYTWETSQWRVYRLLTFYKGKWRYLLSDKEDFLENSSDMRLSGYEIARPGTKKGEIIITYCEGGANPIIKDTIVSCKIENINELK